MDERLGLRAPQDPDAWTAIIRDQRVDDLARGTSNAATGIIEIISRAGIEAQQRTYVLPNPLRVHRYVGILDGDTGPDAAERLRSAVLVRNRDLERATALPELRRELSQL